MEMESETDSTSIATNLNASIREMNLIVQYSFQFEIGRVWRGRWHTTYQNVCYMAGNFRGELIFIIFVVDSAVMKISTHES